MKIDDSFIQLISRSKCRYLIGNAFLSDFFSYNQKKSSLCVLIVCFLLYIRN